MEEKMEKKIDLLYSQCPDLFEVWEQYSKLYKAHLDLQEQHHNAISRAEACHSQLDYLRQENKRLSEGGHMGEEYEREISRLKAKNKEYEELITKLREQKYQSGDIAELALLRKENDSLRTQLNSFDSSKVKLTMLHKKSPSQTTYQQVQSQGYHIEQPREVRFLEPIKTITQPQQLQQSNQYTSYQYSDMPSVRESMVQRPTQVRYTQSVSPCGPCPPCQPCIPCPPCDQYWGQNSNAFK